MEDIMPLLLRACELVGHLFGDVLRDLCFTLSFTLFNTVSKILHQMNYENLVEAINFACIAQLRNKMCISFELKNSRVFHTKMMYFTSHSNLLKYLKIVFIT